MSDLRYVIIQARGCPETGDLYIFDETAIAMAQAEANALRKIVYVRDNLTDEIVQTVRPKGRRA